MLILSYPARAIRAVKDPARGTCELDHKISKGIGATQVALDKGEQHLAIARMIYSMSGFLTPGLITSGKGALLLKQ